ncbi:MAG: sulfurtransferase [endosymbiont of Galathealinum brachiosum]|uniref:Sulfurtransferase n=1 Tax=endosymbiont of Galathealinum brachiosum TaxID=2200906 RepID=A0A370DCX4_9GAMM|nr:MAG: sulfurtransferase [endosymbiont of Galathealinum brachiosum]
MWEYLIMKLIWVILLTVISASVLAEDSFPGRKLYPSVPFIELDDLYKQINDVVIIDARSKYEYETLKIKSAVSIPLALSTKRFQKRMMTIRQENPEKKLVFYCNGHKCMKSYKAAKRSISYLGLNNIFAYDAGVFEWAKKYPAESLLLGEVLVSPDKLISKSAFTEHLLPGEAFIKNANSEVTILDIRDRIERDGFYIFSGEENSISLDKREKSKLDKLIASVKKSNKTLFVYDMVGKQVRWFQYYLESKGIKKYYFMKGGADAFFDIPLNKLID